MIEDAGLLLIAMAIALMLVPPIHLAIARPQAWPSLDAVATEQVDAPLPDPAIDIARPRTGPASRRAPLTRPRPDTRNRR